MSAFFSRTLLGCCLLLCVAGVQVLGLDAGAGGPSSFAAGTGSTALLSYEGGSDEVALPPVAMPLGWAVLCSELAQCRAEGRVRWFQTGVEVAGRRAWRAVSRGPPLA